jgi:hypothetical protein
MPVATSHADVVNDWEALLTAIRGNAEKLPATQELRKLVTQGRELAIRLRGAVKANIGPKSEQLVEFNMKPIRKRPRKTKAGKPPEVTTPTAPPAGTQVRTQVSQPQDSTPEV